MTRQQYIISRKTNMVELGRTLGNISDACRKLGVSRTHYSIAGSGLQPLLSKIIHRRVQGCTLNPEFRPAATNHSGSIREIEPAKGAAPTGGFRVAP